MLPLPEINASRVLLTEVMQLPLPEILAVQCSCIRPWELIFPDPEITNELFFELPVRFILPEPDMEALRVLAIKSAFIFPEPEI
jgi:hypothetical protein